MIRAFDWRDVGLVRDLSPQGLCLDLETGLTRHHRPLQTALLAYLVPGAGAATLVWRADGQAAFGQLQHRPGAELARVLFVAPGGTALGWVPVVEQLAAAAGAHGAHHLIAEVSESTPEFEALRTAGFAVYARQSVWLLPAGAAPSAEPDSRVPLRAATAADLIGISTLYANIVPRLVQQVEPPPQPPRGYVLEQAGEVVAFLDVRLGPRGIWLEPYLHPAADQLAEAAVRTGLTLIPGRAEKPVYVVVRRYQDWLQALLQRSGFSLMGTQAVMVKRLTVRVTEPLLKPLPAIDGQIATPPMAQVGPPRRRSGPALLRRRRPF